MNDAITTLRLEGGKANAMSTEMLDTIERSIDDFETGAARAAVLTGYQGFFSAGLALPMLIDLDRPAMRAFIGHFARVMIRVLACDKPIVAAINGHAIAGGCVLALMCDRRLIVDDPKIRIGLSEAQLGIGLPAIVIEPLRAQVPPASLVPIALEGRLFAPADAVAIGLVHAMAPTTDLLELALSQARALAANPSNAVGQIKRALRAPVIEAVTRTAAAETEHWLDSWFAPEARVRLRAAVDKLARR